MLGLHCQLSWAKLFVKSLLDFCLHYIFLFKELIFLYCTFCLLQFQSLCPTRFFTPQFNFCKFIHCLLHNEDNRPSIIMGISLLYIYEWYIYINKRFSLIEWKSRTNLKVANKAETFFGQTIHYLFSLSIHILRAQTEYESTERRTLMGFTLPPHPPLVLSLSLLFELCLLYLRALALTLPLKLSLSLALRQLEDE